MLKENQERWYVWLYDRDKQEFNVVGPISDDTFWTKRTQALQKTGRNVHCSTAEESVIGTGLKEAMKEYSQFSGYRHNGSLYF